MAFWLALAGMGMNAIGKQQGLEGTVEGAQTQANIEGLSRAAQKRRFDRDIKYQEPFFKAGEKAVPEYAKAVKNEFDITQSPLYKMQKEMIMGELEDAPEGVRTSALERLGAREGEMAKGRLLDLQKIGLGSAGSAGQTALSFGSAFSQSLQRGGTALAQGTLSSSMQRQNMWTDAMEEVSGYPAYRTQQNYLDNDRERRSRPIPPRNSTFTDYDLQY